jgi:hypothetical protein
MLALDPQVKEAQQDVERLQQDWDRQTHGRDVEPLAHVRNGLALGLWQKALELLLVQAADSGPEKPRLECQLLLLLGAPQPARVVLTTDQGRAAGGEPDFMDICVPSSTGLLKRFRLHGSSWLTFLLEAATGNYDAADTALVHVFDGLRHDAAEDRALTAELHALGGLLALERGNPDLAQHHFDESLSIGAIGDLGGRALSLAMRKRLRDGKP